MDEAVGWFMMGILCFIIGGATGSITAHVNSHDKAIEAGVGEYYIDSDNDKRFRYIKPKEDLTEKQ